MNYLNFYKDYIAAVYCTPAAKDSAAAVLVKERLPGVPFSIVESKQNIPKEHQNQKTVFLTKTPGKKFGPCPGSRGHLCCNYLTINLYEGCPIGCTYCIMQAYLNFEPVTVNVDIEEIKQELEAIIEANPDKPIRIGTGETGDSLFYDPLFELSKDFIEYCAQYPNVYFEVKTKTHFIDHLLDIKNKGNGVVAFSLNPQSIIDTEEGTASSLEERFDAAARAVEAGYLLAFHFDPVVRVIDWQEKYRAVAEKLSVFPKRKIVWISLGTIRYPSQLKDRLGNRPWLYDEFVPCNDGKHRYLQRIRTGMYKEIAGWLSEFTGAPLYMCMESPAVWKRVFEKIPSKIESLCAIFTNVQM